MFDENKKKPIENITVAVKKETKDRFEELYRVSEANSKGEFLNILMQNYTDPEQVRTVEKVIEKPVNVEVEKQVPISLKDNELILSLNRIQFELLKTEAESEKLEKLHNYYFNKSENYTKLWFMEIKATDDIKARIGKMLNNLFFYHEINGPNDFFPVGLRNSYIKAKTREFYPDIFEEN